MSLDLYIKSNTPVQHRGTGIYVRNDGGTQELTTKEDVLKYFPDANPDEIEEKYFTDNEFFHMNITHNLTKMAGMCKTLSSYNYNLDSPVVTLYDLLWHPEENLKITIPNMEYLEDVMDCYTNLLQSPEFFKQYNPKNGWGSYEQLVARTKEYLKALLSISDDFDNYTIVTSA